MVHTVLSIDVGIRNLAYCVLEHTTPLVTQSLTVLENTTTLPSVDEDICNNILISTSKQKSTKVKKSTKKMKKVKKKLKNIPEKKDIKIVKWGIINLAECLQETGTCLELLKNKKVCTKKAFFVLKKPETTTLGNSKYRCTRHCNSLEPKEQKLFKPIKKVNCKKIPLLSIGKLAVQELDKIAFLLDVDEVVIENQPALIGPKMKSLQIIIFTYFLINGIMKKGRITNIHTFSARNKLKIYDGPEITDPDILKKTPYNQRKALSIIYCDYLIVKQVDFLDFFQKHKKKDDLADCYLQGLYYLVNYYNYPDVLSTINTN